MNKKKVPKGSHEGQDIKATSSRRPWTPQGADFSVIPPSPRTILAPKTNPQNDEIMMNKSVIFCSASGSENVAKKGLETSRNAYEMFKIDPRRELQEKTGNRATRRRFGPIFGG
jgi:hypothetical protein